jgi:hypothetical protein
METRTVAHLHEQLKTLRDQLAQLADQGRIVMATDDLVPVKDSRQATASALAGLDAAIAATTWMETLATTDGEYPALDGT